METAPALVELMMQSAPGQIDALKQKHPGSDELFSTERHLGEDNATSQLRNRQAIVDLARESLPTIRSDMDSLAVAIRAMMRRVSQIRFIGAIIATAAGGLTGILALALSNEQIQAVLAFAGMLGGIATVSADQFERAPSGVRIASVDEYGKLVAARAELELFRIKLERDTIIPIKDEDLLAMLSRLDALAMSVLTLKLAGST